MVSERAALLWDVCGELSLSAPVAGLSAGMLPQLANRPQPDFPELRFRYLGNPELRRIVLDLVATYDHGRKYSMRLNVALARVALLESDTDLLRSVLAEVPPRCGLGVPLWAGRLYFWELVLGKALAGGELLPTLPELPELAELRNLCFLRYALVSSTRCRVSAELLPPVARTALLLRRGVTVRSDTLPAIVYMLRGEWAAAHREFQALFPASRHLHSSVERSLSAPLLIYAVLNSMQAGGDRREAATWATAAEIVLMNYAPESALSELRDFFANLHVMIALVSGYEPKAVQTAQIGGPLARVPLILCRRFLPRDWQTRLGAEKMAESLQYLEDAELPLLAFYVRAVAQAEGLELAAPPAKAQNCRLLAEYSDGCFRLICHGGSSSAAAQAIPPAWLRLCPGLAEGAVELSDLGDILPLLLRLNSAGIELQWQGEPLLVSDGGKRPLNLRCLAQAGGWFEIGVELQGEPVKFLPELMMAAEVCTGNYLPIGRNRYLLVPAEQLRDLRLLSSAVRVEMGHVYLPVAALPALQPDWQLGLPPRIAARLGRMRAVLPVPPGVAVELRPYQLTGYHWLANCAAVGLGTCLADDMGLGKTLQLLVLLMQRVRRGISLVVAPLSLLENWLAESARFVPGLRVQRYRPGQALPSSSRCDVVFASYGEVVANSAVFATRRWNVLALDEAQEIRNSNSLRARTLCSLTATARVCLTGTPVENRVEDLLSIMHFLNPDLPLNTRGRANTAERLDFVQRLTAPLMLRRTRSGVLSELPPLTEIVYRTELSATERALYESYRAAALAADCSSRMHVLAALTRLRRLCCAPSLVQADCTQPSTKLTAMAELAGQLCANGHRVLIFSQFTDVLDLAAPMLQAGGLSYLRMDGSTPPATRDKLVQQFQSGQVPLFLLSLKVGGTGLNLTAADYVLLLDPWWNPAVEAQAAARSHRSGQQRPVTLCRLIAAGTLEERMLALQQQKKELAESLVPEGTLPLETLLALL